jgi:hypothetical protein
MHPVPCLPIGGFLGENRLLNILRYCVKMVIQERKGVGKPYKNIKLSLKFLAGYWRLRLTTTQLQVPAL